VIVKELSAVCVALLACFESEGFVLSEREVMLSTLGSGGVQMISL
jgi:hypothetical protein